jgi:Skp family chaperone for outer membrane proteins
MKSIRSTALTTTLLAVASLSGSAQQPATRPAAPATQPAASATPVPATGDSKFAIIDTEAFTDPKTGIVKLVRAYQGLEREFKQRSEELQKLRARYDQLGKEVETLQRAAVVDQKTIAGKADEAATVKRDIERKTQDAQDQFKRREREVTEPLYKDIGPALETYARQRGVSVVFDVSKLTGVMFVVNNSVDLTSGFIADYNQRNPAPAAPITP